MKSRFIVVVAISIFSLTLNSQITLAQNKNDDDSLAVLKKKLIELESKLKSQEKKIAELENLKDIVEKLNKNKPFVAYPGDSKVDGKLKNAVPFEFNGRTYYMMPLSGNEKSNIQLLGKKKVESK